MALSVALCVALCVALYVALYVALCVALYVTQCMALCVALCVAMCVADVSHRAAVRQCRSRRSLKAICILPQHCHRASLRAIISDPKSLLALCKNDATIRRESSMLLLYTFLTSYINEYTLKLKHVRCNTTLVIIKTI